MSTSSCCLLRVPPQGPTFNISPCVSENNTTVFNPPLKLGETFHIPQFYTNNWGEPGAAILADANWNSWTGDSVDSITDQTRTTKNGLLVAGRYYVEYFYANQAQVPLVAASGVYSIGDATGDPQNIFNLWPDDGGVGQESNIFTVSGFKYGSIVPSVSYFLFKAYLCRFVYLIESADPALAQIKYSLVFLPIQDKYYYKSILTDNYSLTRSGQNFSSIDIFNSFYAPAGVNQAISTTTWDGISPATTSMIINLVSKINSFNGYDYPAQPLEGNAMHAHTIMLNTANTYTIVPIVSPQMNLEAWITTTQALDVTVVYRASLRGWMTLLANQTFPSLSNTFVYEVNPRYSASGSGSAFEGDCCGTNSCSPNCCTSTTTIQPTDASSTTINSTCCAFTRLISISGSSSSTPGTNVITYNDVSQLDFWLLPTDNEGNRIDSAIVSSLPKTIDGFADFAPAHPYSTTAPKYNFLYVVPSSGVTLFDQQLSTLLLNSKTRFSQNEGATWSSWTSINDISPYINSSLYVGTGTPEKQPGSTIILDAVTENTLICPDWAVGSTTSTNDYIEIAIPLTSS